MTQNTTAFTFGKNWAEFAQIHFNENRIEISKKHLLDFLSMESLAGKSFLDIGCGSGIHSLAAYRAHAARITSFDFDPLSAETTQKIRSQYADQSAWEVYQGSILDEAFIKKLHQTDIVYSWGVLHHTGHLWQAITNAASLVKPDGLLYIAIYDKTSETPYWIDIKKKYNAADALAKRKMEIAYVFKHFFKTLSPVQIVRSLAYIIRYKKNRGMAFWTDIKDWLGGWPYEPATQQEVRDFCEKTLGMATIKITTGEANIEYLFKRKKII
jgi:2-polyprenyl-6-hydroxyphenyl methylase/3-demethylubiquinone-9 3-methyltransferase